MCRDKNTWLRLSVFYNLKTVLNRIKITPDIQVLRDVIYYHGRDIKGNVKLSERSHGYVEQISAIEAIDNESIRTVFNLEKIIEKDYRGYNKEYPEFVGKIRDEIYSLFKNREFEEKRLFLKSYAEEILVSIMKTMNIIKKYGDIARKVLTVPNYHYASALSGYNYLIHKYMPEDIACEVEIALRRECFRPIEHTIVPDDETFKGSGEKFLEEIFDFLRGKGVAGLPVIGKGEKKVIEMDDFWKLSLLNLDGKNMCFSVQYFSSSSEKDQYTTRFTLP